MLTMNLQCVLYRMLTVKVSGFRYLPRAEESYPGMIKKYKAYVKSTPFNF